jgi:hypothetical protein
LGAAGWNGLKEENGNPGLTINWRGCRYPGNQVGDLMMFLRRFLRAGIKHTK